MYKLWSHDGTWSEQLVPIQVYTCRSQRAGMYILFPSNDSSSYRSYPWGSERWIFVWGRKIARYHLTLSACTCAILVLVTIMLRAFTWGTSYTSVALSSFDSLYSISLTYSFLLIRFLISPPLETYVVINAYVPLTSYVHSWRNKEEVCCCAKKWLTNEAEQVTGHINILANQRFFCDIPNVV